MTDSIHDKPTVYKSGFIGLLGWTNVGKSTLVNLLTGMKIAITADSPQTTRHRLVGIVQGSDYQIALTDTPGIHTAKNELSKRMIQVTWGTISGMDVVLWMIFPDKSPQMQLTAFRESLEDNALPVIVAINKIDTVPKERLIPIMDYLQKEIEPRAIIPISALTGQNTEPLLKTMVDLLPENEPLFPIDQVTDQPERVIVAEYIREQVIVHTFQEMPHVVAVEIDMFKMNPSGLLEIAATIFVEKASQKGIVIGAQGDMIKKIGIEARKAISAFLDCRVDLRLWIKVNPKWRNDPRRLRQLGFGD